jgi:hypothetical protein
MHTDFGIQSYRTAPRWRLRLVWFLAGLVSGWFIAELFAALRVST